MAIKAIGLHKYYGNQHVLNDIWFDIPEGQIVGLLGPNGAGKSTIMKILTGYILPDRGEAEVAGISIIHNPLDAKRKIGYLPEHNPLYTEMYVREYLNFVRKFYPGTPRSRIEEVIEMTGLAPEAHKKIGQLSKGYRQRVGLAAAIIHNPPVLILDEPTTGLDPNQLVEIRELIKQLGKNKSIILSTHIMQEVEQIVERVILINKGKIVLDQPVEKLETDKQIITVEFDTKIESEWFKRLDGLLHFENPGNNVWELHFDNKRDHRSALFDFAVDLGVKILRIEIARIDMESLFRQKTGR